MKQAHRSRYAVMVTVDLRKHDYSQVVARVERSLGVSLDADSVISKRRSLGFRSDRNTWVRIEVRPLTALDQRGWNGIECSAALEGVARPEWLQAVSWHENGLVWRADEMELVTSSPVKPGGILTTHPVLPNAWWETFTASLSALSVHEGVTRWATRHTAFLTPARLAETLDKVFGSLDLDEVVWVPGHGDLAWANLTGPECWLLDWEDWGLAPRGFDAATVWVNSLAVPELAERVLHECRSELGCFSGLVARLFVCAEVIAAGEYSGPLLEPAREHAARLLPLLAAG